MRVPDRLRNPQVNRLKSTAWAGTGHRAVFPFPDGSNELVAVPACDSEVPLVLGAEALVVKAPRAKRTPGSSAHFGRSMVSTSPLWVLTRLAI